MPEGPLGGPRPAAKSSVVVYTRIALGGDIGAEDTEKLQTQPVFQELLESHIENNTRLSDVSVRFHPAGFIVGIEVNTGRRSIGIDLAEDISGRSKRFVEDQLGADSELEAFDRNEPAVEVRAR